MNHVRERGAGTAQTFFMIVILATVVVAAYLLLRGKNEPAAPAAAPRYRCMTTRDGLVPLKILIVPTNGARVHSAAGTDTGTDRRLPMYSTWFPLERRGEYVKVGTSATSTTAIGWLRERDVLFWSTKEALRPNKANRARTPLHLWLTREDVGNMAKIKYRELDDTDPPPYPVLANSGGSYQLALIWQSTDFEKVGVATAWTGTLRIPDDARFYYITTKPELRQDIEDLTAAYHELNSGGTAAHPVLQFLKKKVDITIARDITKPEDDAGILQKILRELRGPQKTMGQQPAEIRRDAANIRKRIERLRRFYENGESWDEQGFGWLPSDYLPAN
jgi:hypothetical protein